MFQLSLAAQDAMAIITDFGNAPIIQERLTRRVRRVSSVASDTMTRPRIDRLPTCQKEMVMPIAPTIHAARLLLLQDIRVALDARIVAQWITRNGGAFLIAGKKNFLTVSPL